MLKPHGNDRFGDHPHAGVVVAGVPAHVMVGLIDRKRVLLGGDPHLCHVAQSPIVGHRDPLPNTPSTNATLSVNPLRVDSRS